VEFVTKFDIQAFAIDQVPVGTSTKIELASIQTHNGRLPIPALVVRGVNPGPTVMAVAGVHGNEYEGQVAVRNVFSMLDPQTLSGTFFGIPVCNLFAYHAKSRTTPEHLDGLNLARVFPGDRSGSLTHQLAADLMDLALRNVGDRDLFIDFHSANEQGNYVPLVGFRDIESNARAESEEAARHFADLPVWMFDNQTGMFNAEISRRGIPTLGTETTGQSGCREIDVSRYTNGLLDALAFKGLIANRNPKRTVGPVHRGVQVVSPSTGFMRLKPELGELVTENHPIGEVTDIYGSPLEDLIAPVSGSIWMRRTNPLVQTSEVICIIGQPV
jgi:uncharacterized protein